MYGQPDVAQVVEVNRGVLWLVQGCFPQNKDCIWTSGWLWECTSGHRYEETVALVSANGQVGVALFMGPYVGVVMALVMGPCGCCHGPWYRTVWVWPWVWLFALQVGSICNNAQLKDDKVIGLPTEGAILHVGYMVGAAGTHCAHFTSVGGCGYHSVVGAAQLA